MKTRRKRIIKAIKKRVLRGRGISFLVPFHCPDGENQRAKNWRWLKKYWKTQLPGAEIVMGVDESSLRDPSIPFSKSVAVNNAASKATGDVFVIADADGYISARVIQSCVAQIRKAEKRGRRKWFVPYREFYRLSATASQKVLQSDPAKPYYFRTPPSLEDVQNQDRSGPLHGHWYGAMLQIVSRAAFDMVGGWDERFRGWGGEDVAAMFATDTLYWRHQTAPATALHIWHPMLSPTEQAAWVDHSRRVWAGQDTSGVNNKLSGRYSAARGNAAKMRKLLDDGLKK